jgi:hypothetical protein
MAVQSFREKGRLRNPVEPRIPAVRLGGIDRPIMVVVVVVCRSTHTYFAGS